jgi:type VI secretion system protein ImpA
LQATRDDLAAACDEFEQLTALFEEKCGRGDDGYDLSPPSSNLRQVLHDCRDIIARLVKDETQSDVLSNGDHGLMTVSSDGGPMRGKIQTRDDAFRALLMVADFFQHTEPHSPVSYALRQAVRWGQMPLPELLTELIPDATVRDGLFRHVGIKVEDKGT